MASASPNPAEQAWLSEFEATWDDSRLAALASGLPPPGDPLRLRLLVRMVGIDLRRRWRCGQRVTLESYLPTYPELGTRETVPLELLHAEYQARLEGGCPVDVGELARRFARDPAELVRYFQATQALPPSPSSQATLAHSAPSGFSGEQTLAPTATPSAARGGAGGLTGTFGRYLILKELGRGGMGTVYLAKDAQLERLVALKVPHFSPDDPTALERFHREAKVAATLTHPNLCPIYDVGTVDDVHFLTMPFIEGRPLSALVRPDMPEVEVADLVRRLALALEEAHQKGIIHRDLKPGNVMLNERGEPVVMDFGLARRANPGDVRLTQSGALVGTPAYMPPEQVEGAGARLGPACDVYALGVILYELLTARLPFQGTMAQLICQVMIDAPPPPSEHRPDLDVRLEKICLRAMAKKAGDRYPSMAALAADLQSFLREPAPLEALPAAPADESAAGSTAPTAPRRKRRQDAPSTVRLPRQRGEESLRRPSPRKRGWLGCLVVAGGALLACCVVPVVVVPVLVPKAANWGREQFGWVKDEFARQEDWNALAGSWKAPPADLPADRLFPPAVSGYRRLEHDEVAAVPEFQLTLPGRRARYAGPGGGSVELFAYRATALEKETIYQRVLDATKGNPSGHYVSGSPQGPRVVYSMFSEQEGVLWYGDGWLFLARSRDKTNPQEFLLKFLPALSNQQPAKASTGK
jgi:serine/threonine protein kinase